MSALVATVHVLSDDGHRHVFSPGDDLPEWAARKMGAHCFEGGEHPHSEPAESGPRGGKNARARGKSKAEADGEAEG